MSFLSLIGLRIVTENKKARKRRILVDQGHQPTSTTDSDTGRPSGARLDPATFWKIRDRLENRRFIEKVFNNEDFNRGFIFCHQERDKDLYFSMI